MYAPSPEEDPDYTRAVVVCPDAVMALLGGCLFAHEGALAAAKKNSQTGDEMYWNMRFAAYAAGCALCGLRNYASLYFYSAGRRVRVFCSSCARVLPLAARRQSDLHISRLLLLLAPTSCSLFGSLPREIAALIAELCTRALLDDAYPLEDMHAW